MKTVVKIVMMTMMMIIESQDWDRVVARARTAGEGNAANAQHNSATTCGNA